MNSYDKIKISVSLKYQLAWHDNWNPNNLIWLVIQNNMVWINERLVSKQFGLMSKETIWPDK